MGGIRAVSDPRQDGSIYAGKRTTSMDTMNIISKKKGLKKSRPYFSLPFFCCAIISFPCCVADTHTMRMVRPERKVPNSTSIPTAEVRSGAAHVTKCYVPFPLFLLMHAPSVGTQPQKKTIERKDRKQVTCGEKTCGTCCYELDNVQLTRYYM
ncbi:uncharacterized protein F4807DRAFT_411820 [Annulohypoxylon truncatum]|uniref:uncharacterized protein n=1 Tax=Annulohypoxylon truncatum TaxID=327061 RepID=UPI0020074832|nr:uncharacterized protein F4807DRAFT_411820 [Annulohypoxylon truncatum]KAI1212867.1 hypothetical protein F4807DRAFT_411820 [Annulohypoxylon truncatum]